jgi:nucleoside-diphosphate-sugar epimerase
MDFHDKVLVTGASGFIGGRLVETLVSQGIRVRAAISNLSNRTRLSDLPVEIVTADLADPLALTRAGEGCGIVFHVAYRFGGDAKRQGINFAATRVLAEAFLKRGGRRFVHVSSMSAYGDPVDGDLTEDGPQNASKDPYSKTKRKIDGFLLELHRTRGLPVTIIQPAIVYGPHGGIWSSYLLEQVRTMRIVLPARGEGLCNDVYVDDVVSALIAAADCDGAVGKSFLISGANPVTWREFYRCYERMVGKKAVIDTEEAQGLFEKSPLRRMLERPPQGWLLAAARWYVPSRVRSRVKSGLKSLATRRSDSSDSEPPLFLPEGQLRLLYESKTHIRIDKARSVLGYEPAFDLERGMALTAQWARQANLLAG